MPPGGLFQRSEQVLPRDMEIFLTWTCGENDMIGSAMENLVRWTIVGLELAALAAIAGGFAWSLSKSVIVTVRDRQEERYQSFRRELGRSTLIALELLIAADILRSLVLEPSLQTIGLLAALVAIRTFLSFSIDVELDGCWPWQRAKYAQAKDRTAQSTTVNTEGALGENTDRPGHQGKRQSA